MYRSMNVYWGLWESAHARRCNNLIFYLPIYVVIFQKANFAFLKNKKNNKVETGDREIFNFFVFSYQK